MAVATGGMVFGEEGSDLKIEDVQLHDLGQVNKSISNTFWLNLIVIDWNTDDEYCYPCPMISSCG